MAVNIEVTRYVSSCTGEHWVAESAIVVRKTKTMIVVKFSSGTIMRFNKKSGFPVGFRRDGSLPSFYIEEDELRKIREKPD
jgi:hypothetical protein